MRVAYDARPLSQNKAGIGKYLESLLGQVISNNAVAMDIILCSNREIFLSEENSVELVGRKYTTGKSNSNLWLQISVPGLLKQNNIDLFHGTMSVLPLFSNVPSVITIYDMVLEIFPKTMHWKNWLPLKLLMRASAKKASRIIAISENTKRDIVKFLGVPCEKIKVIYLGVDKPFSPVEKEDDSDILCKYGLTPGFLLNVGTIEPRKNLLRLLKAYKMVVSDNGLMLKLVVAGGHGWLNKGIYEEVNLLGLSENVVFTGYVPDSELPALYRSASAFVYPSLYEGFGLPPLEAMACGTPVISSNVSSIPEVVGDAGILVDPYRPEEIARAICTVLENSDLRDRLKREGLARAGLFTWDKTARETIKLYQEIIDENTKAVGVRN